MTHEELEKWEIAVKTIHAINQPHRTPTSKDLQSWLDAKLIYYLKTGITLKELEKRAIIATNKHRDNLRAQGFKNIKDNIKIND